MSDFAVIAVSGKQFQVQPGDKITIDGFQGKVGDSLELSPVLLRKTGDQLEIGQPHLEGKAVIAKVVSHDKGDKIRVYKYKAKSRQGKTRGFRAQETVVQIESIGSSNSV